MADDHPLSPDTILYLQREKLRHYMLTQQETVCPSDLEIHSNLFDLRWTPTELRAMAADLGGEFQSGLDYKDSLEGKMALKAAAMRERASRIDAREHYFAQLQLDYEMHLEAERQRKIEEQIKKAKAKAAITMINAGRHHHQQQQQQQQQPIAPQAGIASHGGGNGQQAPVPVKRGRGRPRKHPLVLAPVKCFNKIRKIRKEPEAVGIIEVWPENFG